LCAILETGFPLTRELNVGLVNQRSLLDGLRARFSAEIAVGEPPKVYVNQENELVESSFIPFAPSRKQLGDGVEWTYSCLSHGRTGTLRAFRLSFADVQFDLAALKLQEQGDCDDRSGCD
jgi:hypothetical protein